jgi:hypothetical protein
MLQIFRSTFARKLAVVFLTTVVTLVATVALDRITGVATRKKPAAGLIFRPNSHASYDTVDFTFTASINSLGFRDREFTLAKSAEHRVAAIGDSFTYGWGVSIDESWPKVLEANLRSRGIDVEVANLGSPGASPVKYADTAEKAIPLLKPDLILVAILQGDDLEQLSQETPPPDNLAAGPRNIGSFAAKLARWLYPNFWRLTRETGRKDDQVVVTEGWRRQAQLILSRLSPEERKRYDDLDDEIRNAFVSGRLNPALVQLTIKHSEYWLRTLDISQPEVQTLIDAMSDQLIRIKKVAEHYDAKVLVISIPMGIYVNNEAFAEEKRFGFLLDRAMLVSHSEDLAIKMAADKAGLQFFSETDQFRQHEDAPFFFKLDGHLNAAGHRYYADQLTLSVSRTLGVAPQDPITARHHRHS